MFSSKAKKELIAIQQLLGWNKGGVYKRIDEVRALSQLLQIKAPNLLDEHPWVRDLLESTDEFLLGLSKATSIPSAYYPQREDFPRNRGLFNQEPPSMQNSSWIAHAYPLQQVIIKLQGTRHSDKASIIRLLETVLTRLKSGDVTGYEHDDDFGYIFEYQAVSTSPSFFDEPAGLG